MNNEINNKVEGKIWRDAYIITLMVSCSLITIAFIALLVFKTWPNIYEMWCRSTGGAAAVNWQYYEIIVMWFIELVVCAIFSIPLSVLVYLHLISDKEYTLETRKEIIESKYKDNIEDTVKEYIDKAKRENDED